MAKRLDVKLSKLKFPPSCVVCWSPATEQFPLQRIFSFGRGRRAYPVTLNLPMCRQHFQAARYKGPAERLMGWLGLPAGIISGLAALLQVLGFWASNGQGSPILNLFSAGILGIGVFLIVWILISYWLAPLLAVPESKEARNAVQLRQYWPRDGYVRLEFANENLAEMVENESGR